MIQPVCSCATWEHTVRKQRNNIVVVAKQCLHCGRSLGNVKKDQFDLSKLPEFSESRVESWRQKYDAWAAEQKKNFELKQGEWWVRYNQYLNGKHWPRLRAFVMRRDPTCQVCFNAPSEQVHHVSYEGYKKFGISFPVECVGVCMRCHDWLHKKVEA